MQHLSDIKFTEIYCTSAACPCPVRSGDFIAIIGTTASAPDGTAPHPATPAGGYLVDLGLL